MTKSKIPNASQLKTLSRSSIVILALIAFGFAAAGFTLPWWGMVLPAALAGGWFAYAHPSWNVPNMLVRVAGMAALIWMAAVLVHDLPAAGRLSSRVASVMSLPGLVFSYIFTGMIAALIAGLAACVGYYAVQVLRQSLTTTR
jgi:hypothetical protein